MRTNLYYNAKQPLYSVIDVYLFGIVPIGGLWLHDKMGRHALTGEVLSPYKTERRQPESPHSAQFPLCQQQCAHLHAQQPAGGVVGVEVCRSRRQAAYISAAQRRI